MAVALEEMKELLKDQGKEIKGAVLEVKKAHEDLDGRVKKIGDDIEHHGKELSETKDAFQKQVERVEKAETTLDQLVEKLATLPGSAANESKSLGQVCAASEVVKGYSGGNVKIADFKGSLFSHTKDVTSGAASAGDLIEPVVRGGIVYDPEQGLTVRDLLTTLPIATNAIEWVQELLYTNNAAPKAEGATSPGKSDITFDKKSSTVKTVAHWMACSRQVLADARALRAFVDMRLRYGLKLKEEEQLLFGDGTGDNLLGLYPQATAYDTNLTKAGYTNVDQVRKVILQASMSGYPTTAIVMNPSDWAEIELLKTDDKAYLFSNPTNGAETRLWGKRVAESLSMTASNGVDTGGQFLAGAFGLAATLWDREEVTVRAAEQHGDFFIQGMIALLCEERLALTVERPSGLVKGNFVVV